VVGFVCVVGVKGCGGVDVRKGDGRIVWGLGGRSNTTPNTHTHRARGQRGGPLGREEEAEGGGGERGGEEVEGGHVEQRQVQHELQAAQQPLGQALPRGALLLLMVEKGEEVAVVVWGGGVEGRRGGRRTIVRENE
jgi:hypothetical protein